MLKLIKYELIKQKTSKVIIGAILALLEVARSEEHTSELQSP